MLSAILFHVVMWPVLGVVGINLSIWSLYKVYAEPDFIDWYDNEYSTQYTQSQINGGGAFFGYIMFIVAVAAFVVSGLKWLSTKRKNKSEGEE
jgi:hypothetical protein